MSSLRDHTLQPLIEYAKVVERNYLIQDFVREEQKENNLDLFDHSFDAIQFAFRYLKDNVYIDIHQSEFIDCLSYCGVPALLASSFEFKVIRSIESCEEGLKKANLFVKKLNHMSPSNNMKIIFHHGSMQDYFSYDANVLYLDTNIVCRGKINTINYDYFGGEI